MDYLIYILCGIAGVIGHSLMKAKDLEKDAKAANVVFGIKEYVSTDWFGISLSFLAIFLWLLLFGEVANQYPKILLWVRCTFAGMGFFGSYMIQKFASRGKQYIRSVVNEKTDKADKADGTI